MMEDDQNVAQLVGFYRTRPGEPGFAIPVFEMNRKSVVQGMDESRIVDGFHACEQGGGADLASLLKTPEAKITQTIGKPALFAFELPSGLISWGTLEELSPSLMAIFRALENRPFLRMEIAEFLGDEALISEAMQATRGLLYRKSRRMLDQKFKVALSAAKAKWRGEQILYDIVAGIAVYPSAKHELLRVPFVFTRVSQNPDGSVQTVSDLLIENMGEKPVNCLRFVIPYSMVGNDPFAIQTQRNGIPRIRNVSAELLSPNIERATGTTQWTMLS